MYKAVMDFTSCSHVPVLFTERSFIAGNEHFHAMIETMVKSITKFIIKFVIKFMDYDFQITLKVGLGWIPGPLSMCFKNFIVFIMNLIMVTLSK